MALQFEDYTMAYSDATASYLRNCLICESEIEASYNENHNNHKLWQRFRSLASRYLNLDYSLNSNFNFTESNLTSNLNSVCSENKSGRVCCDNCLPEIESFCETYEEWEQLRLRIYQRSEVIAGLMKTRIKLEDFLSNGGGGEDDDDDDDAGDDPEDIQKFKKKFISRVKNNSKDSPHLRLNKFDAAPRKKKKDQRRSDAEDEASASTPIVVKVVIQGSVGDEGAEENDPDFNLTNSGVREKPKPKSKRRKFGCQFCNRFFDDKADMLRHRKVHVQRERRKAKAQGKAPSTSSSSQPSTPTASTSTSTSTKPNSTASASPSPNTSKNSNQLETDVSEHPAMSVTEHGFACRICGQIFSDLDRLRIHVKRHNDELDFKCDVCGKGFGRNSHRKRHMKNLHGIDVYMKSDFGSIANPNLGRTPRRTQRTSRDNKNKAQIRNQDGAADETVNLTDNYYPDDSNNIFIDHYTNDDDDENVNESGNGMEYYNEGLDESDEFPENLLAGHYVKTEVENVDNFIDENME